MMSFPQEWKKFEEQFDQNEYMEPDQNQNTSLIEYCLSDFYIIQKWIDYAKGIGDPSVHLLNQNTLFSPTMYKIAKTRLNKFPWQDKANL